MPDVILHVGGKRYGGWKDVVVRRGIEQIAGTFEIGLTDRWHGQATAWPIAAGEPCELTADGQTLISGYVDDVLPEFDATSHGVTVVGRDKTGDLVDCSAVASPGAWSGRTLAQVATAICQPFGITVVDRAGANETFRTAALQEGETAFEALERAARMRGVLLISDAAGSLIITRAGTTRLSTELRQGENILAGGATYSMRDRFSDYICKGQAGGWDDSTPEQNAQGKGRAADPLVAAKRYRPLIIIAEDVGHSKQFAERAVWEAAVRMGRSARPQVTVQGWHHADGLWMPNYLVRVVCPYLYLDEELLIAAVTYRLDGGGTRAQIELVRPEAFDLRPVAEPEVEDDAPW